MAGVEFKDVPSYWNNRAKEQGKKTVGFANRSLDIQDSEYNKRFDFIIPKINTNLITLDYGCGVGRYSKFFSSQKYVGVDITEKLLNIAKEENPDNKYILQSTPDLTNLKHLKFEQFFTATVLQHNTDEGVQNILSSLRDIVQNKIIIILYENVYVYPNVVGKHIKFRTVDEYENFISKYFNIKNKKVYNHIIHGEDHSLMIFDCERN